MGNLNFPISEDFKHELVEYNGRLAAAARILLAQQKTTTSIGYAQKDVVPELIRYAMEHADIVELLKKVNGIAPPPAEPKKKQSKKKVEPPKEVPHPADWDRMEPWEQKNWELKNKKKSTP